MTQSILGRDNPLPLYYQLKMHILDLVENGDLVEGQMLPSEHQLQEEFKISRATVRQALNELENEGLLERRQGVGTFVSHKKIAPEINKLTSFSEDMISRGYKPGSITLEIEQVIPPPRVREGLKLSADTPVWSVLRLRLADDKPVGLQHLFIPPWLEIEADELRNMSSYYKLLENKFSIQLAQGQETLTAKNASPHEAELLQVETGKALIYIGRITYDIQGRPIEFVQFTYRADRYQYQLSLYR